MSNSSPPKSWRDALPIHPAAELFPLMSESELGELARDIKKHALRERPVFYDDPELGICVLDGRNRLDAFERIGREVVNADGRLLPSSSFSIIKGGRTFDPVAFVLTKNLHRRHLTAEQKREIIAKVIEADPTRSDRQIAEMVKRDHKTVADVREKMEDVGRIPHVEIRTDSRGRKQPAKKAAYVEEEPTSDIGSPSVRYSEAPNNPKPQRGSVSTEDIALKDFSARAAELIRVTKKNNPERFANTSLSFKGLRALGHFFLDLANVCEKKRKAEHDAKLEAEVAAILGEAAS